jgi:hypothetical protein
VNDAGKQGVQLNADEYGGVLGIYNKAGEPQVTLGSDETGGILNIQNKTGEDVVQLYADEYGNGKVGVSVVDCGHGFLPGS